MLFGSSAWSCAPRDNFIGWDAASRKSCLLYTTNNTRFLVLPWVKVPHLASHILGLISRRIASDWQTKYGHPVYLLETFVEKDRFKGTCYKAANWRYVGETSGRSRNDRYNNLRVPIKDIYLYPSISPFIKPKSLRVKTGRKPGGQPGHKGNTLRVTETPDIVVEHKADTCSHCGCDISMETATVYKTRQVVDVQIVPLSKISKDIFGIPVSSGTLVNIIHCCKARDIYV